MKLWLISQSSNNEYDTWDSAVVAAETEQEAQRIMPKFGRDYKTEMIPTDEQRRCITAGLNRHFCCDGWVTDPSLVKVEYLGEAAGGTRVGCILGSFNAG